LLEELVRSQKNAVRNTIPFQSCVQHDAALLDMREYKVNELGLKNDYFFGEFSLNYHL